MNVTFIGMSGAGKSYIGQQFAERYGMQFIDIDVAMEKAYAKPLQDILHELGEAVFLQEQAKQVVELGQVANTVIAPGGSVVYTSYAMEHLKAISTVVYLEVPCAVIEARVSPLSRGIVGLGQKTFAELYEERVVLYAAAAHVTINPNNLTPAEVVAMAHDRIHSKYSDK